MPHVHTMFHNFVHYFMLSEQLLKTEIYIERENKTRWAPKVNNFVLSCDIQADNILKSKITNQVNT